MLQFTKYVTQGLPTRSTWGMELTNLGSITYYIRDCSSKRNSPRCRGRYTLNSHSRDKSYERLALPLFLVDTRNDADGNRVEACQHR